MRWFVFTCVRGDGRRRDHHDRRDRKAADHGRRTMDALLPINLHARAYARAVAAALSDQD